jgi:primase-polymerase (primpol)-like protein
VGFVRKISDTDKARMVIWNKNVPGALRDIPHWVNWRYVTRQGKQTKVPVTPGTGEWARTTDPSSWSTYQHALQWSPGTSGIGFVLTRDARITGIDLDNVLLTNRLHSDVRWLIDALDSYTEISPSGNGLRIFVRAQKNTARCSSAWPVPGMSIEMYDGGRFLTVTGRIYERRRPLRRVQRKLDTICEQILGIEEIKPDVQWDYDGMSYKGLLPQSVEERLENRNITAIAHFQQALNQTYEQLNEYARYADKPLKSESEVDAAIACMLLDWKHEAWEVEHTLRWRRARIGDKAKHEDYFRRTVSRCIGVIQK